jgi:Holliday junction resolvase RusA-like endonuclease
VKPLQLTIKMLPPTTNHAHTHTSRGVFLTDSVRTFRLLVLNEYRHAPRWALPDGDLELTVQCVFPDKRKSDLDNRLKQAQDALALALGFNDQRVKRIVGECAGYDKGRPLTVLTLRAWNGPAPLVVTSAEEALKAVGAI